MSDLTIYIDYISQPSRAVLCFVKMCKIPCKIIETRVFRGDHLTPEFQRISPSQTVPTLVHGDLTLYESHAMLIYLASLSSLPPAWYPPDLITRSMVDCYLHWHHFHVRLGCGHYLFNKFAVPLIYGREFPGIEFLAIESRNDAFNMLEGILKTGKYVARTDLPSIADISCYCEIISLKWVHYDYSKYPNLQKWMAEIGEIPEVKEVHLVYFKLIPKPNL